MADDKIVTKRGIYLYINGQQINNDLKSVQGEFKKLQNEQAKMTIGSEKYIQTGKKIQALDSIIQEHRKQWRSTNAEIEKTKTSILSLGKITDAFNKYFGMITAFIASFTGLTFAMRKCVDDFANLEEEEANVRKYTGMTKEEVKDLNEAFKNMDTRAARTKLNQLAADAGRLGIQGKKDLLEFVEGANIINVSLGEDLGEDAVKNIGKLAQMFGTADEKGLKAGMLSVASAVNEVAQNSSAAEKYLVEFTARVAGTGNQAGIAIPKIMGYASVLDQNMLRSEMAATAVQKVWLKMYQEPVKFAELAGKSVQEFTDLVLSDANEAFLQLMENLSKAGGLASLAPIFEEMKLDGTEAIGVLNTIVANVGKIRKEQEVATKAFEAGTSVIDEYNVQNNTLQATIEKAKKKFQEYTYTLGEKLAPHTNKVISKTGSLLSIISALIDFFIKFGPAITVVVSSLAAYILASKTLYLWNQRQIILNKLLATSILDLNTRYLALNTVHRLLMLNLKGMKESLIQLLAALKINPWVALTTAIVAAGTALYQWYKHAQDAASNAGRLASLNTEVNKSIAEEKTQLQTLLAIAKDETASKHKREKAIEAINKISPKYLGNLSLENINTLDATMAIEKYTKALEANAKMKAASGKITEIESKKIDLEAQMYDIRQKFDKTPVGSESYRIWEGKLGDMEEQMKELNQQGEFYLNIYKDVAKSMDDINTPTGKNVNTPISTPSTSFPASNDVQDKALREATEALETAYRKQTNIIKQEYIERKISADQMHDNLYTEEMRFLYAKIELFKKFGKDTTELEGTLWDKIITEAQKATQEVKKLKFAPEEEKPDENPLWAEMAKGTQIQIAMNEAKYKAGLISHQEYLYCKSILDEQYRKEKETKDKIAAEREKEIRESVLSTISSLANSAVSVIQSAQSREEVAIEKKYKYKLLLAEGDNEATAELEEEKEAELLAVRKKYADKSFAMNVLSITADTAVAAMRAYSAMAGIPIVGPALGIAAAAAAIAAGTAQIAVANQQREQAANMWDGGYTGEGGKYEKKKLIQTHGGEFVANKKTVQILRPVFDIMDYAQRTGNVAALTGPDMARALGSPSAPSVSASNNSPISIGQTASTNPDIIRALDSNTRTMAALKKKLEEPFVGEVYIDGPRGVKQNMADYDKLIKNATR